MLAGLRRAGVQPSVSEEPRLIEAAELVVLPGVGTFQAGIEQLAASGAIDALRERVTQGRATLAVCLGLQLLAEESEEGCGIKGLAVFPTKVEAIPGHRSSASDWLELSAARPRMFLCSRGIWLFRKFFLFARGSGGVEFGHG